MKTRKRLLPRPATLLLAAGLSTGLTSCSREASVAPAPPSLTQEEELQNSEINRLYQDIGLAHGIVRQDRMVGIPRPDKPITYEYGNGADSLYRQVYRFANLRAFRIDIKHRMDSLRRAGLVLRYDTAVHDTPVTESGPAGKMTVNQ